LTGSIQDPPPVDALPERAYRALVTYDGSGFHGWQFQPGLPTVQGAIEDALFAITGQRTRVQGAGRTDAGVHALGQVADFRIRTRIVPERMARALNAHLPGSARILAVEVAPGGFSARFSARFRRYRYRIDRVHTPFNRGRAYVPRFRPSLERMQAALDPLPGEHDFQAFTTQPEGPFGCCVHSLSWEERSGGIDFTVQANRFLYQMVRILVGTMLEIGRGRLEPEEMKAILLGRDRRRAGPLAPAAGLYLEEVGYEPAWPGQSAGSDPKTVHAPREQPPYRES